MFKKYSCYETERGLDVICYELTDKFAFMCPYTKKGEDITLKIKDTLVYCVEMSEDEGVCAIDTMTNSMIYELIKEESE